MSLRIGVGLIAALLMASPAAATWSVVAVDQKTGEVGIAAASCSTGVRLIAGVVPGKGVVASQAATSFLGRDAAVNMMTLGDRADIILKRLGAEEFYSSPVRIGLPRLQYGIASLQPSPKAGNLTGALVPNDWGSDHGDDFSVQGNTLRPGVVDAMASAWRLDTVGKCRRPLAERLLRIWTGFDMWPRWWPRKRTRVMKSPWLSQPCQGKPIYFHSTIGLHDIRTFRVGNMRS